jgi:hypothetical protein
VNKPGNNTSAPLWRGGSPRLWEWRGGPSTPVLPVFSHFWQKIFNESRRWIVQSLDGAIPLQPISFQSVAAKSRKMICTPEQPHRVAFADVPHPEPKHKKGKYNASKER